MRIRMPSTEDSKDPIWAPTPEQIEAARMTHYMAWLGDTRALEIRNYADLHAWSIDRLEDFWASLFDYFEIESSRDYETVLITRDMPGAQWFPGARVNFTRHVLRAAPADLSTPAIISKREGAQIESTSWSELIETVRQFGSFLTANGVEPGDRVVAYVSNGPEAVAAFLASAAIGAVWASCSPDFGGSAAADRFAQLRPKILIANSTYHFGGKFHDRSADVAILAKCLPELENIIHVTSDLDPVSRATAAKEVLWEDALVLGKSLRFAYADVEFSHPLFVGFSSGTTGIPKAIVHGHGGITLEALKLHLLHENLGPMNRVFFYTTTSWIVWPGLISSLMAGGSIVLYDGNPITPDPLCLWRLAADTKATSFGTSPTFLAYMMQQHLQPKKSFDLSNIEAVAITGSPATPATMSWAAKNSGPRPWVSTISGGTDVFTAFVGACPILPSFPGESQCIQLGIDAVALDEKGRTVIGETGELVIRRPMPTMPLYFFNDPTGKRLRQSYFDVYPGYWRHGDRIRINDRGGSFILGRSDSTLNRHGVRIGSAEIYRVLETMPDVIDSLVVNLELPDGHSLMPLFIRIRDGVELDSRLEREIRERLKNEATPRHVPDRLIAVPDIPYTKTGKKMEVPVKKILLGIEPDIAVDRSAMRNPGALEFFCAYQIHNLQLVRDNNSPAPN